MASEPGFWFINRTATMSKGCMATVTARPDLLGEIN